MRKPDWNVSEKSALFNQLHQMRLGMLQTRSVSLATIAMQKTLRTKYSNDLKKAQDAIAKLEEIKKTSAMSMHRAAKENLIDSDTFDSFSKQLIASETILPDLKTRFEKANVTIATEQANIKIIREYVHDLAARKLQSSTRESLRFRKWKHTLNMFQEDARWAAAIEIQSIWRMVIAKKKKLFLRRVLHNHVKVDAAGRLLHFIYKLLAKKRQKKIVLARKAETAVKTRHKEVFEALFQICGRIILRGALVAWKDNLQAIHTHWKLKRLSSAITIQRMYRGFRDRIFLKRLKMRASLTDRVRDLVDQFIVSGNFWGFVLEIDADYRRLTHKIEEEERDASTFMSTVLRQRKLDEDRMMQDWFTASALQNPLVSGADQVSRTYNSEKSSSHGTSTAQAVLQSALVEDLVALSPTKKKDEAFPPDFPAKTIRQAMAKGFSLDDVVAVMRGLQAQRKDIEDTKLVLSTLEKRAPLMQNSWESERALRESKHVGNDALLHLPRRSPVKRNRKRDAKNMSAKGPARSFISENLLESIPGGMNGPIARLLLVAALGCYDAGSPGEKGAFVPCEGHNSELFKTYTHLESPLAKIRWEQQAMEAVKPFLNTLVENRCYTAYDILYNVRGVNELVSWNIPRPLAKNIYSVIAEIHTQSTHVSKRNIIREVRVSADFERFLRDRAQSREKPTVKASPQLNTTLKEKQGTLEVDMLEQVRSRLEHNVLELPLQNLRVSASDLLFKAAFLLDEGSNESPTINSYQAFLTSLLSLQTSGDTNGMKGLIKERVARAKLTADEYADIFQLFDIKSASDLLDGNLIPVLIRDQKLQEKVTELLRQFVQPPSKVLLKAEKVVASTTNEQD